MMHPPDDAPDDRPMDRPALLAALRARLDRNGPAQATDSLPLCEAIGQGIPGGGLARAALHEVLAAEPDAAAGFCAMVLARAAASGRGSVLWIAEEARPPGLARFGLSPADLVLVPVRRPIDGLWAMEESLRCPGVAGALLMLRDLDPEAARRLQLAAGTGGALGLLLRPDAGDAGAAAALTRWRVGTLAGSGSAHDLGDPRWQLELLRCRGGRPGKWQVTWRPAAERLDVEDAERLDGEDAERLDGEDTAETAILEAPARPARLRAR